MAKENKSLLQVATENSVRQGTFSIQFISRHCHPSGQQIFAGLSSFGFDCGNFFSKLMSWKTISAVVNFKRLLCVIVACERFSFWKPLLDKFLKKKTMAGSNLIFKCYRNRFYIFSCSQRS